MDFDFSDKVRDLQKKVGAFMDAHIYPNENRSSRRSRKTVARQRLDTHARHRGSQARARAAGLWNLCGPRTTVAR